MIEISRRRWRVAATATAVSGAVAAVYYVAALAYVATAVDLDRSFYLWRAPWPGVFAAAAVIAFRARGRTLRWVGRMFVGAVALTALSVYRGAVDALGEASLGGEGYELWPAASIILMVTSAALAVAAGAMAVTRPAVDVSAETSEATPGSPAALDR